MEVRVVAEDPSGLGLLVKAGLGGLPLIGGLPGIAKTGGELPALMLKRERVELAAGQVARYARVCDFVRREAVPLTYPHLLGFGLQLSLMTQPTFPHLALGQVHLANTITAHRSLTLGERVDVCVWAANQRPHPKGIVYDMLTEISVGDEAVWEETSTYLRPGRPHVDAHSIAGPREVAPGSITWRLPRDLGRRYASVSGDRNPIHLTALTAKAFGFKQQIAHGMWSLARCVAAIESRLPEAVTVEAAFKKPIFLPGRVNFGAEVHQDGSTGFGLTSPEGRPHLTGLARAAH